MKENLYKSRMCELYDRECIGCMECEISDLDSKKICDNCCKFLEIIDDAVIKIEKIITGD